MLVLIAGSVCAQLPAGHNVFFLDMDQDGYGDPAQGYLFPSTVPPNRLWTNWGNDPNDKDNKIFPIPVAKGSRQLAMEVSLVQLDLEAQIRMGKELGVSVFVVNLRWDEFETSKSTFATATVQSLGVLAQRLAIEGMSLVISLDAINGKTISVPDDMKTLVATNPDYLASADASGRVQLALSRLKAALGARAPKAIQLGRQVDTFTPTGNAKRFWTSFATFIKQARSQAKILWGNELAVGVSGTMLGILQEPTRSVMLSLATESDWVFASFSPAETGLMNPLKTREMVEYLISTCAGKPLVLMPVEFPSAKEVGSSEVLQSQFWRSFFGVWDIYSAYMPLVTLPMLQDNALYPANQAKASYGQRTSNGVAKAAYHTLRNLTFERDWPLPKSSSRKFRMGFSLAPYDAPASESAQVAGAAYIDSKIKQYADFISLHMDGGIPWKEALADPFNAQLPPYPSVVMDSWRHSAARLDRSKKIMVSINPMGVPRSLLAPSWGYGEDFVYDKQFNRIGTGQFKFDERRLPDAPFDHLSFDAYEVKVAFLKYAIRTLQYFKPDYLCFAIEVSAADVEDPAAFKRYVELHKFIFSELKKTPDGQRTKLLVSFSATSFMADELGSFIGDGEQGASYKYDEMAAGMRSRLQQGVQELHPYLDVIGLSLYPHFGKYKAYTQPANMYDSMMEFLSAAGVPPNKPLAITESGYSADPVFVVGDLITGSPDKQRRHLDLMMYELQKSTHPVEFVVNYLVRDSDLQWNTLMATTPDPQLVEFYKYFRDIGLYDGDGVARPALNVWANHFQLPYLP